VAYPSDLLVVGWMNKVAFSHGTLVYKLIKGYGSSWNWIFPWKEANQLPINHF